MAEAKKGNMISILSQNRRVFIDVRNRQNNDALIRLMENRQERMAFVDGLPEILDNYPKEVSKEIDLTKEILKRFAILCGISYPTQPGWYSSIIESYGALWSLTLCDKDNQWFNIMACDDFLSAEQCLPTEKHIIGLYGSAQTGKTPTIKKVFRELQKKYHEHAVVFEPTSSYDAKGIFFVGNAKVGIDGQGDPYGRQVDRSIAEFVSVGCDIILVSSRNFGMTVDAIDRYQGVHEINWAKRLTGNRHNAKECERINRAQAEQLISTIEQIAATF